MLYTRLLIRLAAQPRKRPPRSSWTRFEAELPTQMWQTDFTHNTLANGEHVEILNFLDDHSRYLLACVAFPESAAQRYSPYSATPSPATASRPACYPTTAWSSPPASPARIQWTEHPDTSQPRRIRRSENPA